MNTDEAAALLSSVPEVARIKKMPELKAGEVIVCECDRHIPFDMAGRIQISLGQIWPGHQIVVLGDGLRLKIMPADEVPK